MLSDHPDQYSECGFHQDLLLAIYMDGHCKLSQAGDARPYHKADSNRSLCIPQLQHFVVFYKILPKSSNPSSCRTLTKARLLSFRQEAIHNN